MMSSIVPFGDDPAAVLARARAHVHDPVGGPHRFFVVLDDDQRVAQVAQPLERADEALVVALVQADARLVQDVQHAGQPRADLGRQSNALRLATRERGRRPTQRQIVEPDVDQKPQSFADLLQDLAADRELAIRQRQTPLGRVRVADIGGARSRGARRRFAAGLTCPLVRAAAARPRMARAPRARRRSRAPGAPRSSRFR